ncbi:MAG: hypothetical protein VKJ06_09160 [Vampirovibrionales bacterium]|nr:hypothetical protein [Vampirovibrionales bacterium]
MTALLNPALTPALTPALAQAARPLKAAAQAMLLAPAHLPASPANASQQALLLDLATSLIQLIRQTPSSDKNTLQLAEAALLKVGPTAVPLLAEALTSDDMQTAGMSAMVLIRMGRNVLPALSKLPQTHAVRFVQQELAAC